VYDRDSLTFIINITEEALPRVNSIILDLKNQAFVVMIYIFKQDEIVMFTTPRRDDRKEQYDLLFSQ
jgi:hypothetical protein